MDQLDTFLHALKVEGNLSSNTIEAYAGDLRRFLGFLNSSTSDDHHEAKVTPVVIMDFLEAENDSGFSPSTLQRRKMVLSQFAQYLVSIGEFDADQAKQIHKWHPNLWQKIYHQNIHVLSAGEIDQMLATPKPGGPIKSYRDLAIISLLLETGMSISDVLSLRVEQVDLKNQTLLTDGTDYAVYKIPRSVESITKYLSEERPEVTQSKEENVLFISQLGGPMSRQGGWQMIKNLGSRMRIGIPLSPRVLRHTAVKMMIEAGLTPREIQNRLGHTNIYSTRALIRKIKRTNTTRKEGQRDGRVFDDGKN
ncbi:MAG: tyrosine-type recombinase/integrase [Anaerolineales bacterium]|jgi:integrase/recombinase XerD